MNKDMYEKIIESSVTEQEMTDFLRKNSASEWDMMETLNDFLTRKALEQRRNKKIDDLLNG
jgi:hypothetical protein